MSTKMAETDWSVALEVFRASRPRRGDKGRDDRLFLEALHYFSVHNISWRALPERFGKWNSVWKRFDRLSRSGVFETSSITSPRCRRRRIWCRCSTAPSCAPMFRQPVPKGAEGSGARSLARRLLNQNPPEDGLRRPSHRLRSDRRGEGRCAPLPYPAGARARCRSACGRRRQGLRQQGQQAGGAFTWHHPGHSAQGQREGQARFLRKGHLQGPRPYRAGRRQAQALQAGSPTLREDEAELRIHRRTCSRIHLSQIRPHRLVTSSGLLPHEAPVRRRLAAEQWESVRLISNDETAKGSHYINAGTEPLGV